MMEQVKISLQAYQESEALQDAWWAINDYFSKSIPHFSQREPSASTIMECATNGGYKEVIFKVY